MLECQPIRNYWNNEPRSNELLKKQLILGTWHYTHQLFDFNKELNKLEELLESTNLKGKEINSISFFNKTAIWGYYGLNKNQICILYASEEGLHIEISYEMYENIEDFYDFLIDKLVIKENLPEFPD